MRKIFTLSLFTFALVAASFNSFAQTCTALSTTAPGGVTFGAPITVSAANGFTSTGQSTPFVYTASATSSITSPIYFYNCTGGNQATINFSYTLDASNGAGNTVTPTIEILYDNPLQSFSCTATSGTVSTAGSGTRYYFSITPTSPFPCNTNFQIRLTLATGTAAITAVDFSTDATPASGSLPVKFSGVEGRSVNGNINLTWNVAGEESLSHYEVEKSGDNRNYTTIGSIKADGKDSYSFLDTKATTATSYYRVKAVDLDGKLTFSPIVTMKGGKSSITLRGFPMPVINDFTLSHSTATAESQISISSAEGREVKVMTPAKGSQQTVISLSSLHAGVYVVRYTNGNGEVETLKIVKQ